MTTPRRSIDRRQGVALRDARRRQGLTQAYLAKALGLTQQAVSGWENGAFTIAQRRREALAWLLDTDAASLFRCACSAPEGEVPPGPAAARVTPAGTQPAGPV